MSFFDWKNLLRRTIEQHAIVLKPGAFLAINIADILCFRDDNMPRIMAENVSRRKRAEITRELVMETWAEHPTYNRRQIAELLGCSEQTVDRRMKGNNIRGGKYETQTRVKVVGGMLEEFAIDAGLYLYDRRVWVKDAASCRRSATQRTAWLRKARATVGIISSSDLSASLGDAFDQVLLVLDTDADAE